MATLIQQLDNVINIIDTTKPAGEKIIYSLSTMCVAKAQRKGGTTNDMVAFWDADGRPTGTVYFNAALEVQDVGGVAAPFGGDLDELLDKLNNEYFATSSSVVIGGTIDVTSDQQVFKEIGLIWDLTADDQGNWVGFKYFMIWLCYHATIPSIQW